VKPVWPSDLDLESSYELPRKYALMPRIILMAVLLTAVIASASERGLMDGSKLQNFATRYTAAWCSQNAASVASFFGQHGSLKINDGAPSVGRDAITKAAQSFMTAFPDLVIKMDRLTVNGKTEYHWTLTGTNTGPGGTRKFVRISGFEEWRFGPDGLIAESLGHFDASDYQRQLNSGAKSP
jgi:SnoaL-like polyketide cyclase